MFITMIKSLASRLVAGRAVFLVVCSAALGAGLAVGVRAALDVSDVGVAPVVPAVDARFVALGKAYLPQLGKVYATAWVEGAGALESGQPIDKALQNVSAAWDAGRTNLFDRLITPELVKILPEGQDPSAITPAQRQELSRAFRGFAVGLGGSSQK
ncbi:MAG TPA: hypothetical protein VJY33_14765 [Isosphaeraceae bacterium]|nr:hypothetical protein [Isosphaeraceae bacterium]